MALDLYGEPGTPDGFAYKRDIIDPAEEAHLLDGSAGLPFEEFAFRSLAQGR